MLTQVLLACALVLLCENDAARILAYYPTPLPSHQGVFRPFTLELVKRGHEVVVITTDPIFPKGDGPKNLKEIDVHDLSYSIWKKMSIKIKDDFSLDTIYLEIINLVEQQMNTKDVQEMLKDKSKTFDLIIVEAYVEPTLAITRFYDAPIIQFSTISITNGHFRQFGAAMHPLIYPSLMHEKVYNLTVIEKLKILYDDYKFDGMTTRYKHLYDAFVKRVVGPEAPPFEELSSDVDMLFLNVFPVWDFNRPVPPNVIYLGGLNTKPEKSLPKDLQTYLDSSKNGVIYVSFGTNVDPAVVFPDKIPMLVKVFSELPYDVLWKWNYDELPGRTPNIKISKWLPQPDLLRHPNIKAFITQAGLQSTDEAIVAGVPLIGIPVFGDQKFNVEQFVHFKIGERVEIETITEDKLREAINKVAKDDSYRKNVVKLRSVMHDQPQTPLERAVWWTEYVIRHKGAKHLRSPAANMSMAEYLELELVGCIALVTLIAVSLVVYLVRLVYSAVFTRRKSVKIKKNN